MVKRTGSEPPRTTQTRESEAQRAPDQPRPGIGSPIPSDQAQQSNLAQAPEIPRLDLSGGDGAPRLALHRPRPLRPPRAHPRRLVDKLRVDTELLAQHFSRAGLATVAADLQHGGQALFGSGDNSRVASLILDTRGTKAPAADQERFGLRLAWWNDAFFGTDRGFTNDGELGMSAHLGDTKLGVDLRHRMLTERRGPRRWDEVTVSAMLAKEIERGDLTWTLGVGGGLALGGDLGGAWMQDRFHRLPFVKGRRLDPNHPGRPLQSLYDGDNTSAATLGAKVGVSAHLLPGLEAEASLTGQAAIGDTGLTGAELVAGLRYEMPGLRIRPVLSAHLDLAYFTTPDANLRLAGGYRSEQILAKPRFRIGVRGDGFEFGWEARLSEGDRDHHIAGLYFQIGSWSG